jgi:tetratricopeptide (TPR) repeat protein
LGDTARAKEIYEEGIVVCREVGYTYRLPVFLVSLGYMLMLEGDYERGAALNGEAAALCRERGYKSGLQYALDNLGWAALLQGDHDLAKTSYQEGLAVCKELGDKMIASESLEGLACIAGAQGQALRAARLFGAAQALSEAVGAVAYQHTSEEEALREPYLFMTHSRLDEAAWEGAWAEGRAMSMEQAIEYALPAEDPSATTLSSTTGQASLSSTPEHPA